MRPQPTHPVLRDVSEALGDGHAEEVAHVQEEDGDGVGGDRDAATEDVA